jgi:methionyl-tRNA formyltransferase
MGSPEFALPSLRALASEHEVVTVYTQPDRPSGRGSHPVPTPAKRVALELGIPVRQPESLRNTAEQSALTALAPDVICVAAYGLILPPEVLHIPRHGCINVHASLLPRHRGAAPVHRAILAGDEMTGVSIMRMEEGLDTGPYALQTAIDLDDLSVDAATTALADAGAVALLEVLRRTEVGTVEWVAQDDSAATYAPKITRGDVAITPDLSVDAALRRVRASTRSASCRVCVAGRTVTIVRASCVRPGPPQGTVAVTGESLVLGLSDGGISIDEIRPDGRGCMDGACFARGARFESGAAWGPCA